MWPRPLDTFSREEQGFGRRLCRFGIEVFEPDTANTLMAALLVRDIVGGTISHDHPWQDEAHAAVHGGLWRGAYEPRSVLGLAAVLGYAASRS